MERGGEPGEYRDEIEICPRCGSTLIHDLPHWARGSEAEAHAEVNTEPQPADVAYDFEAFVPVYRVADRSLVPLIHSLLRAAGMRYFIRDEQVRHLLPLLAGPVVMVEPSRVDEARDLLAELAEGSEASNSDS